MAKFLAGIEFWHWWVLAAVLIVIEVLAPSTVFLWPGIAAGVVGIILFAFPGLGWEIQVLIFAVLSVVSVILWRAYARTRPTETDDPMLNLRAQRYVGREFVLEQPIVNGRGKLMVDGVIWKVEGEELGAGTRIRIADVDGVVLKVERA